MIVSPEIEAAALWLEDQAEAVKSGAGLDVSAGEVSFARQRLIAGANGLRAGLHLNEAMAIEARAEVQADV